MLGRRMEYALHITRARRWSNNAGRRIAFDEWLELVDSDPELSADGTPGPAFAAWDGFSSFEVVWFEWRHGNVSTKTADAFVVEKMLEIAAALRAGVQGPDGEPYPGPDDDPYRTKAEAPRRGLLASLRRRLFGRG